MWAGEEPGFSLSEHDRGLRGLQKPSEGIRLTRPFSRLPRSLFDDSRWVELQAGRWQAADHITIGEARAVTKVLSWLAKIQLRTIMFSTLCKTTVPVQVR